MSKASEKMRDMQCPVCSNGQCTPTGITYRVWPQEVEVYKCHACASCVVYPLPDDDTLNAYYSSEWTKEMKPPSPVLTRLLKVFSRVHITAKSRFRWPFVKPWLSESADILEIGAGDGSFSGFLRQKGSRVSAIEPSQNGRESLEKSGIRIVGNTLDNVPQETQYNAILAYYALEHLNNPHKFLKTIKQHLHAGGYFLREVPNVPLYPEQLPKALRKSVFHNAHLFHFSCNGMEQLLKQVGFSNVECQEIGFSNKRLRVIFPKANFHLLHPSFQASIPSKMVSALHAVESTLFDKSVVVAKKSDNRKGFIEPNDFIFFNATL